MVDEQKLLAESIKTTPASVTTIALKSILQKSNPFVDEALLYIGDGKLETKWVDPAHVGMGSFVVEIPSLEDENIVTTAADIEQLSSILRPFNIGKKKQRKNREPAYMFDMEYHCEHNQSEPDKRWYRFVNPDLWFKIGALDPRDISEPQEPKLSRDMVDVWVDRVRLQKAIKVARKMVKSSGYVSLVADLDGETLQLQAKRDFNGDMAMASDLTPKNPDNFEREGEGMEGTVVSRFSIDYFGDMFKPIRGDTVLLKLSDEYPLCVEFHEFEDEPNPVHGQMLLAPRIENE